MSLLVQPEEVPKPLVQKLHFEWYNVLFIVGGIVFQVVDMYGFDLYNLVKFHSTGHMWYFYWTLALILLPGISMSLVSCLWYCRSADNTSTRVNIIRILCHIFLLSPVTRNVDVLYYGRKCKAAADRKDERSWSKYHFKLMEAYKYSNILQLVETYFEAAPQLLLRFYIMIGDLKSGGNLDFWQVAAVIFSMLGQAWGLISYKLACHFAQDNKEIKDIPGLVILFLGHFFGVWARIFPLALCASFHLRIFFDGCAIHIFLMSLYVTYCWNRYPRTFPFAWPSNIFTDWLGIFFTSIIHIYAIIIISMTKFARWRYIFYLSVCFVENTAMMILWWLELSADDIKWYHYLMICGQPLSYLLSLVLVGYSHRLFGHGWPHPKTHVANAYDRAVLVKVSCDQGEISLPKDELYIEAGYIYIPSREFRVFKPGRSGKPVYISIVTEDDKKQLKWGLSDVRVGQNYSIIVSKTGDICETLMGKIWTDKYGHVHLNGIT